MCRFRHIPTGGLADSVLIRRMMNSRSQSVWAIEADDPLSWLLAHQKITRDVLPCGLPGGDLVDVFLKAKSKFFWYDFMVRGERFRGSTKKTDQNRAEKIAALKLAEAIRGSDPLRGKLPTLVSTPKNSLNGLRMGVWNRTPPLLPQWLAAD